MSKNKVVPINLSSISNPAEAEEYAARIQEKVRQDRERLSKLEVVHPGKIAHLIGGGENKNEALEKINKNYKEYDFNSKELESKIDSFEKLKETHKSGIKTRFAAFLEGEFGVAFGSDKNLENYKSTKNTEAFSDIASVVSDKVVKAKERVQSDSLKYSKTSVELPMNAKTKTTEYDVTAPVTPRRGTPIDINKKTERGI